MSDLEHSIRVYKGYDHHDDPHDQRGAHGATLSLIAKGPLGAISCDISTGWMLRPLVDAVYIPGGKQRRRDEPGVDLGVADCYPSGAGVHGHSATRDRDWWLDSGPCNILGVDVCYGDSGYLLSDDVLAALIEGGDEAAFARLDDIYSAWLGPEVPA